MASTSAMNPPPGRATATAKQRERAPAPVIPPVRALYWQSNELPSALDVYEFSHGQKMVCVAGHKAVEYRLIINPSDPDSVVGTAGGGGGGTASSSMRLEGKILAATEKLPTQALNVKACPDPFGLVKMAIGHDSGVCVDILNGKRIVLDWSMKELCEWKTSESLLCLSKESGPAKLMLYDLRTSPSDASKALVVNQFQSQRSPQEQVKDFSTCAADPNYVTVALGSMASRTALSASRVVLIDIRKANAALGCGGSGNVATPGGVAASAAEVGEEQIDGTLVSCLKFRSSANTSSYLHNHYSVGRGGDSHAVIDKLAIGFEKGITFRELRNGMLCHVGGDPVVGIQQQQHPNAISERPSYYASPLPALGGYGNSLQSYFSTRRIRWRPIFDDYLASSYLALASHIDTWHCALPGSPVAALRHHTAGVCDFAWADHRHMVTSGKDLMIRIADLGEPETFSYGRYGGRNVFGSTTPTTVTSHQHSDPHHTSNVSSDNVQCLGGSGIVVATHNAVLSSVVDGPILTADFVRAAVEEETARRRRAIEEATSTKTKVTNEHTVSGDNKANNMAVYNNNSSTNEDNVDAPLPLPLEMLAALLGTRLVPENKPSGATEPTAAATAPTTSTVAISSKGAVATEKTTTPMTSSAKNTSRDALGTNTTPPPTPSPSPLAASDSLLSGPDTAGGDTAGKPAKKRSVLYFLTRKVTMIGKQAQSQSQQPSPLPPTTPPAPIAAAACAAAAAKAPFDSAADAAQRNVVQHGKSDASAAAQISACASHQLSQEEVWRQQGLRAVEISDVLVGPLRSLAQALMPARLVAVELASATPAAPTNASPEGEGEGGESGRRGLSWSPSQLARCGGGHRRKLKSKSAALLPRGSAGARDGPFSQLFTICSNETVSMLLRRSDAQRLQRQREAQKESAARHALEQQQAAAEAAAAATAKKEAIRVKSANATLLSCPSSGRIDTSRDDDAAAAAHSIGVHPHPNHNPAASTQSLAATTSSAASSQQAVIKSREASGPTHQPQQATPPQATDALVFAITLLCHICWSQIVCLRERAVDRAQTLLDRRRRQARRLGVDAPPQNEWASTMMDAEEAKLDAAIASWFGLLNIARAATRYPPMIGLVKDHICGMIEHLSDRGDFVSCTVLYFSVVLFEKISGETVCPHPPTAPTALPDPLAAAAPLGGKQGERAVTPISSSEIITLEGGAEGMEFNASVHWRARALEWIDASSTHFRNLKTFVDDRELMAVGQMVTPEATVFPVILRDYIVNNKLECGYCEKTLVADDTDPAAAAISVAAPHSQGIGGGGAPVGGLDHSGVGGAAASDHLDGAPFTAACATNMFSGGTSGTRTREGEGSAAAGLGGYPRFAGGGTLLAGKYVSVPSVGGIFKSHLHCDCRNVTKGVELNITSEHSAKTSAHVCAICCEAVEGVFHWFPNCGHGAHPAHLEQWIRRAKGGDVRCPKCAKIILASEKRRAHVIPFQ